MLERFLLAAAAIALAAGPLPAQPVIDDFGDGDFTNDPAWTGDLDRFVVAVSDTLNWLRSNGLPQNDTLHLSTASSVATGYWRFRFRHEVSLSNVNGSRIYVVASSGDLKGEVDGYYVQFGTNNLNRVELWRQDGLPHERVRLGVSDAIVPGLENTLLVEVTRDEHARWTVLVDQVPVIWNVVDGTYTASAALGVWVKHNATGRDRFYWTDFVADPDPGDITPPFPLAAAAAENGAAVMVQFSEPLDAATVTPEGFWLEPGIGLPLAAQVAALPSVVRLEFAPPIPEGAHSLTVTGIGDLAGNVQHGVTIEFVSVHDPPPPVLSSVLALDETTVRAGFDVPVLGCDPGLYSIAPGAGQPTGIECPDPWTYDLLLGQPLVGPQVYVLTASGLTGLSGTVQEQTSAAFFFGEFDVPGPRDVVINEIMYAPSDLASNEFVEIYNRTDDRVFDLSRLRLSNATSPHRVITAQPIPVAPGDFVVLARNANAFESRWPDVPHVHVAGFPALLNGGDTVQIILDDGTVIDAVPYLPGWGGQGPSLERRDPDGPSIAAGNWGSSDHPSGATPGAINAIFEPDVHPPVPQVAIPSNDGLTLVVVFDEPLNPESVTPGAFSLPAGPMIVDAAYFEGVDFRVALSLQPALLPGQHELAIEGIEDLVGNATTGSIHFQFAPDLEPPRVVEVRPMDALRLLVRFDEPLDPDSASEPANYELSEGLGGPSEAVHDAGAPDRVLLHLAAALDGPHTYTLTVRGVEDVHGNAVVEQHVEFFFGIPEPPHPGDLVINEIMYAPADVQSNEYVELHNPTDRVFDLAELRLGDQATSVPVSAAPHLVAPREYVVLVRNASAFAERFPGVGFVAVPGFPVLLNSGDAVVIRHAGSAGPVTIDSVFYRPAWGGQGRSLERRSPDGPSHSPMNWASSLDPAGGTPGAANSVAPDTFSPQPVWIEVSPVGTSLAVYFDEPLDPLTVVPPNFTLSEGGHPAGAAYDESDLSFVATLTLNHALSSGQHTLTISGVSDLLGNATEGTTIDFDWQPDVSPPAIVSAVAVDMTTVRVRFSEAVDPVTSSQPNSYHVSEGIGTPEGAFHAPTGDPAVVLLELGAQLSSGVLYMLTVSGVADLAGNVQHGATAAFILGAGDVAARGDVVINEIMYREAEGGTEYVELRNVTEKVFDLSGFTLSNETAPRPISADPVLLAPHEHLAIARNTTALRRHFGDAGQAIQMANLPSLRNSGDAIVLRFAGATIDSVYYAPAWQRPELRDDRGIALERLDAALSSTDGGNWTSSLDPRGGTPGLPNSVSIPSGDAPAAPGITVSPSPFDAQAGTVIRYRLAADAGLVRIRVFDGAGRHVRTLEDARLAGRAIEGEVIWNGRNDRGESLRVGIYIVLLEAVDMAGGTTESHRAPVVLARRW